MSFFMDKFYLETARMYLRGIKSSEGHELFELDSDPEVMKYLSGGKPSTREQCEKAVIRMCDLFEKHDQRYGYWFAVEKTSGDIMGWFLLRPDHANPEDTDNPELGYRLKKRYWGKGYATEGSIALLQKAFVDLKCKSVFAITMKTNLASQKVMQKIGMTFVSEYTEEQCYGPDGEKEAVRYSITQEEYSKISI